MRIYTRSGDQGRTSLMQGRIEKDALRVESYGTIDEINAQVGEALTRMDSNGSGDLIEEGLQIQQCLLAIGSDLAQPFPDKEPYLHPNSVQQLEDWIDKHSEELPELHQFILPGGTRLASSYHLCRVVTRRAERRVVALTREVKLPDAILPYLNRLSDYFFVVARVANQRAGFTERKN